MTLVLRRVPGSRLPEHSPSHPLVPLGLELRLVLEYPEEAKESRGEGPGSGEPWAPARCLERSKVQWPVFRVGEARLVQGSHSTELCSCLGLGASGRGSLPCPRAGMEEEEDPFHFTAKLAKAENGRKTVA